MYTDPLNEVVKFSAYVSLTEQETLGNFRGDEVVRSSGLYYNVIISFPSTVLLTSDVTVYAPIQVSSVITNK